MAHDPPKSLSLNPGIDPKGLRIKMDGSSLLDVLFIIFILWVDVADEIHTIKWKSVTFLHFWAELRKIIRMYSVHSHFFWKTSEPFTELSVLTTQGVQPSQWECIHISGCGSEDTRTSNCFGVFFLSNTPPLVEPKHTETPKYFYNFYFSTRMCFIEKAIHINTSKQDLFS